MHCGKWCIHHTIFLHAPNPSSTLCAQSHTPLIKNIIKLQPPLHHIYTGKHTSLVTVGDTAKPATIVKLFRLPLEKTFLYISQTKNTWHGLVLHRSLYRLTQGPWISKSIGGLAKHLWILPLNKHMDLSYAEHKKLANSYSKEPRFETAIYHH